MNRFSGLVFVIESPRSRSIRLCVKCLNSTEFGRLVLNAEASAMIVAFVVATGWGLTWRGKLQEHYKIGKNVPGK